MSSKSTEDFGRVLSNIVSELPDRYDVSVTNDGSQLRVMVSKHGRLEEVSDLIRSACDNLSDFKPTIDSLETSDEYIFVIAS